MREKQEEQTIRKWAINRDENKRGGNRSKVRDSSYDATEKKKKKCDVLWVIGINTGRQKQNSQQP